MLTKNIATMLTTNIANTFIIKLKLCSPQILLPNAHQKYCCQMLTKNIATMLTTNIANTFIIKLKL